MAGGGGLIGLASIPLAIALSEKNAGLVALAVAIGLAGLLLLVFGFFQRDTPAASPEGGEMRKDTGRIDPSPGPTGQAIREPKQDGRVFVTRSIEELVGIYKDRTSIQAARLTDIYLGKWLTVTGAIKNVGEFKSSGSIVTIENEPRSPMRPSVFLMFTDRDLVEEHLLILSPGDRITVEGRISQINRWSVDLDDCELIRVHSRAQD